MRLLEERPWGPQQAQGFSLLETLVVISLIAITAMLASPNTADMTQNLERSLAMQRLNNAVAMAKSSAITSGETVTLCRSLAGVSCGGEWGDGLLSFIDRDSDRSLSERDTAVHWQSMADIKGFIHWRTFGNRQTLLFSPGGVVSTHNGSFTYCSERAPGGGSAKLFINRTARTRIELGAAAQADCR